MKTNLIGWWAKTVRLAVLLLGLAISLEATAMAGAKLGERAGRDRTAQAAPQQTPAPPDFNLDLVVAALR